MSQEAKALAMAGNNRLYETPAVIGEEAENYFTPVRQQKLTKRLYETAMELLDSDDEKIRLDAMKELLKYTVSPASPKKSPQKTPQINIEEFILNNHKANNEKPVSEEAEFTEEN